MNWDQDSIIGDILDQDSSSESVFLAMGMSCMGCPASRGETIREACEIHGIDPAELLLRLRGHN